MILKCLTISLKIMWNHTNVYVHKCLREWNQSLKETHFKILKQRTFIVLNKILNSSSVCQPLIELHRNYS